MEVAFQPDIDQERGVMDGPMWEGPRIVATINDAIVCEGHRVDMLHFF